AKLNGPVLSTPWGTLEYMVETPFGVDLTFAERTMGERKVKRSDLQNVTVMIAMPGAEEFRELLISIGWGNSTEAKEPEKYLNSFYGMVIARDGEKLIGCAGLERVRDSIVLISDVCVLPEYQGNGIGKRIMAGVDTWLEAHKTKDMLVFLFTTSEKVEFYKQFGYRGSESGWHGLYKFVL
ncbi:MAG: GNAT family N-acetyltransferase, partial [Rhabdochlamydiaceae bacterium]